MAKVNSPDVAAGGKRERLPGHGLQLDSSAQFFDGAHSEELTALYRHDAHLVHDLNIGGVHQVLRSDRPVPAGHHRLAMRLDQGPKVPITLPVGGPAMVPAYRRATLLIQGEPAGTQDHPNGFNRLISWSGLDIGMDRGSPVSYYAAPFEFTGRLRKVSITLDLLADLDGEAIGQVEMARQ